jgi:DNA-binding MarR family transcriptional regulator
MFSKSTGSLTGRAVSGTNGAEDRTGPFGRSLRRGQGWQDALTWVKLTYQARRVRDQLFDASLFAEPSWDIMLDLYAAHLEGRQVTVADACVASSVPSPTALRYIDLLVERGLLVRSGDEGEGGARGVELSAAGKESMQTMFLKLRALADSHAGPDPSAD